jgi:hypothetical protein
MIKRRHGADFATPDISTSVRDRRLMASRGAFIVGAGGSYLERSGGDCCALQAQLTVSRAWMMIGRVPIGLRTRLAPGRCPVHEQ